jgi:hypothetical protein
MSSTNIEPTLTITELTVNTADETLDVAAHTKTANY